ncbi:MAG: sensor histidine kinase [Bryobacteraceae bacterium]
MRSHLRWVLTLAFAGLLGITLGSGLAALGNLNRMHASEQAARRLVAERAQVLAGLCLSIQIYDQTADRYLEAPSADMLGELARLEAAVDSGFHDFPTDEPRAAESELRGALAALEDSFGRQKTVLEALFALPEAERRRQAPEWIVERIAPIEIDIWQRADALRAYNRRQLDLTDQNLVGEFAQFQSSLAHSLTLALSGGLILIAASMFYILRLERQTETRYQELARSRGELERLSARLLDAQEAERRKLSRELHDEVGQTLGVLLMDIGRLSSALGEVPAEVAERIAGMRSQAERSVETVRNMALLLRPSMLDDLGLIPALEWQGREVSRSSRIEVEVEAEGVSESLADETRICLYRLVQEALHNAVRHSGARNARVRIEQSDGRIRLRVTDDGHGFDPARTRGLGILGMEERVRRLGGKLRIQSEPGKGTTVEADLPV